MSLRVSSDPMDFRPQRNTNANRTPEPPLSDANTNNLVLMVADEQLAKSKTATNTEHSSLLRATITNLLLMQADLYFTGPATSKVLLGSSVHQPASMCRGCCMCATGGVGAAGKKVQGGGGVGGGGWVLGLLGYS